jgi:hypothetical protein
VNDAVAQFVAQGNACRLELIDDWLVHRELQISARLNNQADGYAGAMPGDNGVGQPRKFDHVKRHVYSNRLGIDELD